MFKLNVIFITLLCVSGVSNIFLYKSNANTAKLLIQSEQTESLSRGKNSALVNQIQSMQDSNIKSQLITDALQKEVFLLNKKSQKTRVVIKEVIKNAPCYREPIIYPAIISLHYD